MGLSEKFVRNQLNYWKPLLENLSLDTIRKGQDRIGKLMYSLHRKEVAIRRHDFPDFPAAWVLTRDKRGHVEFERETRKDGGEQMGIYRIPYDGGEFVLVIEFGK